MANRYAVATGSWGSTSTWSATDGGAPGASSPGAADAVFLTATSGNITVSGTTAGSTYACLSIDCTGFTGTFSLGATSTLQVAGALCKFVSTMTLTLGSSTASIVTFAQTVSGTVNITTGGRTLGGVQFGTGASSSAVYTFLDAFNASGNVALLCGTISTSNQTCVWGTFSSSSTSVRALTLGSSSVTITGAGASWTTSVNTNMTLSAGTSTLTFSNGQPNAGFGSLTYYSIVFSALSNGEPTGSVQGNFTCTNMTVQNVAVRNCEWSFANSFTVTGALTVISNSVLNRIWLSTGTPGTQATITASSVVLSNVDLMDIVGAGTATWTAQAGTTLGDCGGNLGIAFDASVTQTWNGTAGGNWSTNAWTTRVPIPQDDVIINAAFVGAPTIAADMRRLGRSVTWTGVSGSPGLSFSQNVSVFGSWTMAAGMGAVASNAFAFYLCGRSACTITCAGISIPGGGTGIYISAPNGSYTQQDNWTMGASLVVVVGAFVTASFALTAYSLGTVGGGTKSIALGSSSVTLSGTGNVASLGVPGLTFNAGTSAINLTGTGSAQSFIGAGFTFYNLTVPASSFSITFSGANTFNNLTIAPGRSVVFTSAQTTVIGTFAATGQGNGYQVQPGVVGNYITSPDSSTLDITGNITLDCRVALLTWKNGNQAFCGKWGAPGQLSYLFYITSGGLLVLGTSSNGTTVTSSTSTVALPTANATTVWVRVSAAAGVVTFYTAPGSIASPASTDWTQLGGNATVAASTTIFNSTADFEISSYQTGLSGPAAGNFYEARVYNAALGSGAGTPVFDANFTTKPFGANSFAESSVNAAIVTINGSGSQVGDGRVQVGSSTQGTQATLQLGSSTASQYNVIQDISVLGNPWYVGHYSVNGGDNSNVIFGNGHSGAITETRTTSDALTRSATRARSLGLGTTFKALQVSDGATHRWKLNETSGSTAIDDIGGANGTYSGTHTLATPGLLPGESDGTVTFGNGGNVSVPYVAGLYPTGPFSMELLYRGSTTLGPQVYPLLIGVPEVGGVGVDLKLHRYIYGDAGNGTGVSTIVGNPAYGGHSQNVTCHTVLAWDGATLSLYLNGKLLVSSAVSVVNWGTGSFSIATSGATFWGSMEAAALYGVCLSATQVAAHWQATGDNVGGGELAALTATSASGMGRTSTAHRSSPNIVGGQDGVVNRVLNPTSSGTVAPWGFVTGAGVLGAASAVAFDGPTGIATSIDATATTVPSGSYLALDVGGIAGTSQSVPRLASAYVCQAGVSYSFSTYFRLLSGLGTLTLSLQWYGPDGTFINTSSVLTLVNQSPGGWGRYGTIGLTAPAGAKYFVPRVQITASATGAFEFRATGFQSTATPSTVAYVDGNQSGDSWLGAANASPSLLPSFGRSQSTSRAEYETYAAFDTVSRRLATRRPLVESHTAADSLRRRTGTRRTATDAAHATDALRRRTSATSHWSEAVNGSDTLHRGGSALRRFAGTASAVAALVTRRVFRRTFGETYVLVETFGDAVRPTICLPTMATLFSNPTSALLRAPRTAATVAAYLSEATLDTCGIGNTQPVSGYGGGPATSTPTIVLGGGGASSDPTEIVGGGGA